MKKYFAIALAVLAVAGCRNKENEEPVAAGQICVEPLITKATEVNFEDGDKIGLTVVTDNSAENYATNACLTYAGDVFSGDLEWYAEIYAKSNLYAYYPYSAAGTPDAYCTVYDQSAGIGAADFMVASKTGVLPTTGAVTMVFKHMMTKLVINVDNQSGAEIETIGIDGTPRVTGLDLINMTFTEFDGALPDEVPDPITAYEAVDGKTWQAIVIPHSNAMSLVFTLSSKKVITQSLAAMALKSGGQYTINARILPDEVVVSASGEIENWTNEGEIGFEGGSSSEDAPVEFTEADGYFVYDGVEYKTVTLADGNTWMAENLRFIPRGRTVSSDPAEDAGIWYPAANAEKVADPALAETLGLLYDAATAFGVEEITADNAASFEGCQGICPTGWHVPTVTEMTGLVGHCSNSELVNPDGAYYDATIKGASLATLADAGWGVQFAGVRNKASITANGSYMVTSYSGIWGVFSQLLGSTNYQVKKDVNGVVTNIQYYYFQSLYNASNETLSVAYGNFLTGASLRCVKNR